MWDSSQMMDTDRTNLLLSCTNHAPTFFELVRKRAGLATFCNSLTDYNPSIHLVACDADSSWKLHLILSLIAAALAVGGQTLLFHLAPALDGVFHPIHGFDIFRLPRYIAEHIYSILEFFDILCYSDKIHDMSLFLATPLLLFKSCGKVCRYGGNAAEVAALTL